MRDYAIKKNHSKPLWAYLPLKLQTCIWRTSADRIQIHKYAEMNEHISVRAYLIFCPVMHSLDIIFFLLSISGIILEFALLREVTTTDGVSIELKTIIHKAFLYVFTTCSQVHVQIKLTLRAHL